MTILSRAFATLAEQSNGKFFTVKFRTQNGHIRTMNCRTGVIKALKGGACNADRSKYIVAYDMQIKQYRSINKDTIVYLAIAGEKAISFG